ncbi:hypothetical protein [Symbioplanes lichenis]|uniref:hypothetical protein n=1 Tax=Symbioplanes lichenis TaxID=1629072 RepID=UPI002739ADF1|nr:hypothetical protein [Actinoplanes lichenis]
MTTWDRWVARLPAPGLLNFLAGLFAGTGINLLTSSAVGDGGGLSALTVLDSIAWVLGAALVTVAATMLQNAEAEAALLDSPMFEEPERREIRMHQRRPIARRAVLLILGGLLSVILAVVLLPFLA